MEISHEDMLDDWFRQVAVAGSKINFDTKREGVRTNERWMHVVHTFGTRSKKEKPRGHVIRDVVI